MAENNILVSVIVPVYNVENYIEKCLESIVNQTYKNLQIILVDDGSTDKSGEICDKYVKMDERVEVIHKENNGLVSARKSGIVRAKGIYTVNVDGDDWIETDAIEKYVMISNKYHPDIIMVTSHYNDYEASQNIINSSNAVILPQLWEYLNNQKIYLLFKIFDYKFIDNKTSYLNDYMQRYYDLLVNVKQFEIPESQNELIKKIKSTVSEMNK